MDKLERIMDFVRAECNDDPKEILETLYSICAGIKAEMERCGMEPPQPVHIKTFKKEISIV